ncbi:hypothetical protein L1049_028518 [Liquidambar formosana]|uniref:Bacterial Ig-like domain-containing protein n=1 Tax=Liquidambar formosana TaxID=63359 RepID=A0AAP0WWB6_LIQFO
MGLLKFSWVILFCWVFLLLRLKALSDGSEVTVNFLKAPLAFSHLNSATFVFEVLVGGNGDTCSNCRITCKLDERIPSDCEAGEVSYSDLQEGNHIFEVCTNGSQGVGCASYNWTVDTVPPTAYVTASTSFTNALNVSVNISFSEPCTGGGGFGCSSVNACNLLVYGAGQVMPSSLNILQPNLKFSVLVGLSTNVQYGRVILVMDKNFCTDSAGNKFARSTNSSFFVHFDSQRPAVKLSTTSNIRTREHRVPISIKFMKPVFGFNSSHISISGGHLQSFHEMSRSIYTVEIQADNDFLSINVPENITGDVAGNKNLPSNVLQVRHYSVPLITSVISIFATASFVATSVSCRSAHYFDCMPSVC